jgi:hypothetical protein
MWNSLKDILPSVAAKFRMRGALDAIEICHEYRSIAPRLLPKDALKHTAAKSYKNCVLTITARSPIWAQEVHMRRHLLKDQINHKFGQDTVKKVRIVIAEDAPSGGSLSAEAPSK